MAVAVHFVKSLKGTGKNITVRAEPFNSNGVRVIPPVNREFSVLFEPVVYPLTPLLFAPVLPLATIPKPEEAKILVISSVWVGIFLANAFS